MKHNQLIEAIVAAVFGLVIILATAFMQPVNWVCMGVGILLFTIGAIFIVLEVLKKQ